MKRRILVISPCRDEARYLRRAVNSLVAQTLQPSRWVVVDDGSTDETSEILEEYTRELDCLRIIPRQRRAQRRVGAGVIEPFDAGLRCVDLDEYAYLCKLDMDVELPPRYF